MWRPGAARGLGAAGIGGRLPGSVARAITALPAWLLGRLLLSVSVSSPIKRE